VRARGAVRYAIRALAHAVRDTVDRGCVGVRRVGSAVRGIRYAYDAVHNVCVYCVLHSVRYAERHMYSVQRRYRHTAYVPILPFALAVVARWAKRIVSPLSLTLFPDLAQNVKRPALAWALKLCPSCQIERTKRREDRVPGGGDPGE